MSEMQLMEFDFDGVDDVKPMVPDVQPARGSKKQKNKNNKKPANAENRGMNNNIQTTTPTTPVDPTRVANHADSSQPVATPVPTLLEQVSAAFDVLPEFINDTNAITTMMTSLLPLKKGSAAVITGLAAAIIAYYCLSVKEE